MFANRRCVALPAALLAALIVLLLALTAAPIPAYSQGDSTPVPEVAAPPPAARLYGLSFEFQLWCNCGPVNLTMALSYYGWEHDQNTAASWLKPSIEDRNVSPGQLALFVNQQTEIPYLRALWRYGGNIDLIKRLIAAGFPVVVESGFQPEDQDWMGHYMTIVAYDDTVETIWIYDSYEGQGPQYQGVLHSYDEFDSWWRHFNRVFLVVYPLDRENDIRAILGDSIDPEYAARMALDAARQEATADQTDVWAWFNAGTSATRLGLYDDAAIYYDEAFRLGLPFRMMWYQFGPYEAYYHTGRYDDVIALANNTEATTIYVEETRYWRGMAYAALGRTDEAISEFNAVLSFNPNFADARTAKEQVETGVFVPPM